MLGRMREVAPASRHDIGWHAALSPAADNLEHQSADIPVSATKCKYCASELTAAA